MIASEVRGAPRIEMATAEGWRRRLAWPMVMLAIALLDAMGLTAAFILAYLVRFRSDLPIFREVVPHVDFYLAVMAWALPVWLMIFVFSKLYDRRYVFEGFDEYTRVAVGCSVGALGVIVISFFYDLPSMARAWLVMVWLFSIAMVCTGRFLARRGVWKAQAHRYLCRRAIIVGGNEEGRALAKHLNDASSTAMRIVGFVDRDSRLDGTTLEGLPILGSLHDLAGLIGEHEIRDVLIAPTSLSRDELVDLYRQFGHDQRIELRLSSGLFELLTTGARVQEVGGIPLVTLHRVRITGVDAFLKAALDAVAATLGLVLVSPVMLAVAVAVRLDGPGPILHRRRVLGRNGVAFDAFKFRTMISDRRFRAQPIDFEDRRRPGVKPPIDPRVTRIGRFLRRTSLDELPQLFNVLRGEMSLVGPRMISPQELARFGPWQVNLLTVKPGITGPWQVRGRATLPYDERVDLCMEYIRGYSIWRDLEILMRTIPAVIRGKGAF